MSMPLANPQVLAADRYVPDWLGIDRTKFVCLDRNECTRHMSGVVAEAITQYVSTKGVNFYPDDSTIYPELARYCGVPSSFLLATNGSDQAIDVVLRCFLGAGDRMLVATPAFAMFKLIAELAGGVLQPVDYLGAGLDFPYEEFSAAVGSRPRVIVFINPNNPTGTPVDPDYIEQTAASYPDIPVIVDEAYFEFTRSTVAPLVEKYHNIIVLRTFSKAFAMAGLRLGYIIAAPELIDEFAKVRNPFDVNSLAVVAGLAQLRAIDEVNAYAEQTMNDVKPGVVRFLVERGVPVVDGAANFVLVKPGDCDAAVKYLREADVLVRPMSAGALRGMFRVSMGTWDEMDRFCSVFDEYLKNSVN